MRHSDEQRQKISEALTQERSLATIEEDQPSEKTTNVTSMEPKPCFPCCSVFPDLTEFDQSCWNKRQRNFYLIRVQFKKLVESKWFDNGILVLILASSTVLVSI